MKIKFSASLLFVMLVLLFACNSNKQVPNAGKQANPTQNNANSNYPHAEGKVFEAGDTTTQKTEHGSVKSLRTPEDIKAAEERKKAAEPEVRQQRILEAAELFAGNYCNCKGDAACKDKIMQDVNSVMNDTGMGLTDDEKHLFKSTFDMRTKNCQ